MINIKKVKAYSIKARDSKVQIQDFAKKPVKKASFLAFYRFLPNIAG